MYIWEGASLIILIIIFLLCRRNAWYFLPWHFDFLCRYQTYPEEEWGPLSLQSPLLQMRRGFPPDMPPIDRFLGSSSAAAHELISATLWEVNICMYLMYVYIMYMYMYIYICVYIRSL